MKSIRIRPWQPEGDLTKKEVGCRPRLSGIAKHLHIHAQTTHPIRGAICTLYMLSKFGDFDRQGTSLTISNKLFLRTVQR